MNKLFTRLPLLLCVASLLIQMMASAARAQQTPGEAAQTGRQEQAEDVLRITTELVQTDVTVFDKQGRFMDGLKKEDFELRVDGKPAEINFFERVVAGSVNEEAQLAAARGVARTNPEGGGGGSLVKPLDRGRVVAFFIDDLHMSFPSMKLARTTILNFIDKEMSQNDLVVIASASGRIGFLQQYTDNKEVLRTAVSRIEYKSYEVRDMQRPPMSPYQAILIDRNETDVKSYFIEETIRQNPGITLDMAESIVMGRVGNILSLAARNSSITLSTLESLARSSAALPGRKLVFFISDGFFLDTRRSDTPERIRRIADAAARSGVVIYSMDSKGLVSGMPDASAEVVFDPTGRLQRATAGELTATQDVMNAIAIDTGGRFVRNTNVLEPGLNKALKETSVYYLLAWRPDTAQRAGKYRKIEVGVKNHPDATVRMQRGFFETTNKPEQKPKESGKTVAAKTPADPLKGAIGALFPVKGLPMRLALSYMDIQNAGLTLVAAMKIEGGAVKFSKQADGKQGAIIDVAGTILNSQGKQLDSFRERLIVTPTNPAAAERKLSDITYNFRSPLKPGLYQVRVAALDQASGQVGSATQWLEVPDLSKQQLSMSSLIVGERKPAAATEKGAEKKVEELIEGVPLSVDRLFGRSSHLRFVVYVYNAARGAAGGTQPDVALQIQLLRDDQPVLTTPLRKLPTEAQDLARLAYAAEIPLQTMAVGQYVLQVTAIDRIAKTSTSQRVKFEIQ